MLEAPERTRAGSGSPCREAKHNPGVLNLDTFYHAAQAALGAPYNFIVSSCNNTGKCNNNVKLALIKMKGVCFSLLFLLSQGSLLSCAQQSEKCFQSRRQPPSPNTDWPFPFPSLHTPFLCDPHGRTGRRKTGLVTPFSRKAETILSSSVAKRKVPVPEVSSTDSF